MLFLILLTVILPFAAERRQRHDSRSVQRVIKFPRAVLPQQFFPLSAADMHLPTLPQYIVFIKKSTCISPVFNAPHLYLHHISEIPGRLMTLHLEQCRGDQLVRAPTLNDLGLSCWRSVRGPASQGRG